MKPTTYRKGTQTLPIENLKANFKTVVLEFIERCVVAGFSVEVEVYNDNTSHGKYAFQNRGLEFRFLLTRGDEFGLKTFGFDCPAFKRGCLSGKPIRLEIQTGENIKNVWI